MGLGSVLYFTFGGVFTGVYANAVRRRPLLASPGMLVACTASGVALGYMFHRYEESRTAKLFEMTDLRDLKAQKALDEIKQ